MSAIHKLEEIEKRVTARLDMKDMAIIHRAGFPSVLENLLLVVVSPSPRWAAFDVRKSIINDIKDFHKSWKKEVHK